MRLGYGTASALNLVRCTRCVLPETYPGISYDENGVCNHCREHANTEVLGEQELRRVLEQHRSRSGSKYDCAVALSGGRDSTYTIDYVVKKLGLTPIAFTIDNGYMPPETIANVASAVKILGVDHVFVRHELLVKSIRRVYSSWQEKPSAGMVSMMCLGCRLGMRKAFVKIAKTYGMTLCISGAGEPEKSFARALLVKPGKSNSSIAMMKGMFSELLHNPRYFIDPRIPVRMVLEFMYEYPPNAVIRRLTSPGWHYLPLFRYIRWNEEEITRLITDELGWKKFKHSVSAWRSDCKINLIKNELYLRTLGFSKNDEILSAMIRIGQITREQAMLRLNKENVIPREFLEEFLREIDVADRYLLKDCSQT
jgi:hypothetical protein